MKNVVITGTSRGIGFELAQLFAKNDFNVLALSRNSNTLEAINHKNITTLPVDLTDEKSLELVSEFVKNNWKQVDILIHNAGTLLNKEFSQTSTEDFINVYQVNVFAVASLTQCLLPFFVENTHTVTISSMGGVQGSMKFAGLAAYSSSKGAVITLSELLAEEYRDQGYKFNVLAIGAVQTEMLAEAFPDYQAPLHPLEMAQYIFDFANTGAKFYNGKVLQVSSTTP
ncbi:SDR family oxidoreductase [Flavicella sp.]|uniref:SDR family NAD(P)-dependent oxidoreductase n=1 Tax=Flavicella sp. TaxID=2957742 RepID=UPI002611B6BB|nr:SDR family oxidoreductase [Flavicella sp.]MDG1804726.1 SDR family NAD(P)-dependent oxidoreductase [Flavicella sp.]MDG2280906.1 SDR family NAD(P)-dependent oxidoreductase [Flavicella sp.]